MTTKKRVEELERLVNYLLTEVKKLNKKLNTEIKQIEQSVKGAMSGNKEDKKTDV